MIIRFFFLFLSLACFKLNSQTVNTFGYSFTLIDVSFSGTERTQYIPIRKDDGKRHQAPQWKLNRPTKPVAYVSGTKAIVLANILTDCDQPIWVRGNAVDKNDNPIQVNGQQILFEKKTSVT